MIDVAVSQWLHAHTTPELTRSMLLVSRAHGQAMLLAAAAVIAAMLLWRHQARWLPTLLLTVPGGMLLNAGVKEMIDRPRPHWDDPLVTLDSYSFPSGHAAGATFLYGFVAAWLLSEGLSRAKAIAVVAACSVLVLLVCFSRVYLGVHYLTDVTAGVVEGLAWLALCLRGTRSLRQQKAA